MTRTPAFAVVLALLAPPFAFAQDPTPAPAKTDATVPAVATPTNSVIKTDPLLPPETDVPPADVESPSTTTELPLFDSAAPPLTENPAVQQHPLYGGEAVIRNPELIPPPESPVDFEINTVNASVIPAKFRRQTVQYQGLEAPGTIVVDPQKRFLYFVLGNGEAVRYGVGVGRAGFAWAGNATIELKRRWPRWLPPEEMVFRDEKARKWANGMPGGPTNPLGARALYLYANGVDTLYRIHGTNEPQSIGKAMSSGCIRMLNEDVAELFDRVQKGTPVVVLGSGDVNANALR